MSRGGTIVQFDIETNSGLNGIVKNSRRTYWDLYIPEQPHHHHIKGGHGKRLQRRNHSTYKASVHAVAKSIADARKFSNVPKQIW